MRRISAAATASLAAALSLAACRGASAPAASAPGEEGAFAFVAGGDTTVVEEYTRTGGVLEGEIRPRVAGSFGRARYRAEMGDGELIRRIELSIWRPGAGADSAPARRWTVTFHGDSVAEESPASGGSGDVRRAAVPRGTLPVFGPSMALQEQVLRRARALPAGEAAAGISLYSMATDGRVARAAVGWVGRDSAALAFGGAAMRLAVDARGRILGGASADAAHRIVRLR